MNEFENNFPLQIFKIKALKHFKLSRKISVKFVFNQIILSVLAFIKVFFYCHMTWIQNMEIKYDRPRKHNVYTYIHTHANIYMAHQIRGWPRNVNSSNNHLSKIDTRDKVLITFRHFKGPLFHFYIACHPVMPKRRTSMRDRKTAHTTIKDLQLTGSIFCFTAPLWRNKLFTSRELNKMTLKCAITATNILGNLSW